MSPIKESVIRLIESLPENCTLDDIQYHLYVREKVQRGLKAVEDGRIVSTEEAERRFAGWVASFGPNSH